MYVSPVGGRLLKYLLSPLFKQRDGPLHLIKEVSDVDPQVLGLLSSGHPGASVRFPDLRQQLGRLRHYVWQVRRTVPQGQPWVGAQLLELQQPSQRLVCKPQVSTARRRPGFWSRCSHVCTFKKDLKQEWAWTTLEAVTFYISLELTFFFFTFRYKHWPWQVKFCKHINSTNITLTLENGLVHLLSAVASHLAVKASGKLQCRKLSRKTGLFYFTEQKANRKPRETVPTIENNNNSN